MANYFVDQVNGNNTDDGTTMDAGGGGGTGAWATIEKALTTNVSVGDIMWVRRGGSEIPTNDIQVVGGGTEANPKDVIGWPRAADASISSATWTNGSTTVDLIVGLSMDRAKHLGRFITGPDGYDYLITKITDANTIIIDRKYASTTVSGASGTATIKADEDWYDDMGTQYGFDDSGWAIKESDWDADVDDLSVVDFNNTSYQIYHYYDDYWHYKNLEIRDSTDAYGAFRTSRTDLVLLTGCLFHTSNNVSCVQIDQGNIYLNRCILTGAESGANNLGLSVTTAAIGWLVNCAIYSMGGNCINCNGSLILENVNLAIEGPAAACIADGHGSSRVWGVDVSMNATSNFITNQPYSTIQLENFGKVLGAHFTKTYQGTLIKLDVVAGSGDPFKRSDGADSVLEVLFNDSDHPSPMQGATFPIFEHEFEATTDTKNYRYYVQAGGIVTASELYIEVEYVSVYDDTSEYVLTKVTSDEAFTARADANDWAEYMEVTGITPAVASKVRIKCYCSYYHAVNKIYIDPLVVIS